MSMNPARRVELPTVISADTGHALVLLNTQTGQVTAHAGADRDRWIAEDRSPAPIAVNPAPPGWGTSETPACLPAAPRPGLRWLPRAAVAVGLTLAVRGIGPRQRAFPRLVGLARAATGHRPFARRREAENAVRAVRWVARCVPARVACLEESIATLITLALSGHRADWCHGIATDPIRMHAWIEINGQPIDESASTGSHTPLIRIAGEAETGGAR